MSDKIIVRVAFKARATWTKDVEMTQAEYDKYCGLLDRARGAAGRALEEDMAADMGFDWSEEPNIEDPELDDFYKTED